MSGPGQSEYGSFGDVGSVVNSLGHFHLACAQRTIIYRPHALLHLARHIIVAHDGAAVAQATRLSLHHEHPERVAGPDDQGTPRLVR